MDTPRDDINSRLLENEEKIAKAIYEFDGTPIDEARNFIKNEELSESYRQGKKTVAEEKQKKSAELLKVLKDRNDLITEKKTQEEEQREKEVLALLTETKQQKIAAMLLWLKNNY
jgi:hypothetical protein